MHEGLTHKLTLISALAGFGTDAADRVGRWLRMARRSVRRFEELDQVIIKVYPGLEHGIADPDTHKILPEHLNDLTAFIKTRD